MILLSLGGADGPLGIPLVADLADFTGFLTPPTGALAAVPVAFAGLWGRRPRFAFRRVLRISSRDWSSLSAIFDGWKYGKGRIGNGKKGDLAKGFDRVEKE